MKILNKEIEFDFLDVESLGRYETALEEYLNEVKEIKQFKGKDSEGYKMLCEIVYDFFDKIIGKGTGEKILGKKRNFRNCLLAMEQIVQEKQNSDKEISDILNRYSPEELNELNY